MIQREPVLRILRAGQILTESRFTHPARYNTPDERFGCLGVSTVKAMVHQVESEYRPRGTTRCCVAQVPGCAQIGHKDQDLGLWHATPTNPGRRPGPDPRTSAPDSPELEGHYFNMTHKPLTLSPQPNPLNPKPESPNHQPRRTLPFFLITLEPGVE